MHQLAKVTLENEMDLVLAHRRSMKLAEIAGLSLPAQTTFATAVSEVSRNAIERGKNGCLTLGISEEKKRSIVACIKDDNINESDYKQGLAYAQRLVDKLNVFTQQDEKSIELYYYISSSGVVDMKKLDEWRSIFRNEPPISAYDEIKRKNEQLQEMAEKLTASEHHFRELTDTLPLMMFSMDAEGNLSYINQRMSRYFGYGVKEVTELDSRMKVHEADRPPTESIRTLIKKEAPILAEWRIQTLQGDFIWHLVSIHPVLENEKVTKWFGFLADINARKLVEQTLKDNEELKMVQSQLQSNIRELNRSNEELQQFAYIASHDLQEPLRKIIYYSDYIQKDSNNSITSKSNDYLQSMISASGRMRNLVNDLLAFSQVERTLLNARPVDLAASIEKALSTYEIKIKEKNAKVLVDPLPVIDGDETMLQRLFENILSNALKYSQEDVAPEIVIKAAETQTTVELRFTDNGIGFEKEFATQVFGIFQRLHTKETYPGTGIGLAICRKIVEIHGGTITVESQPGKGAEFIICLPKSHGADAC